MPGKDKRVLRGRSDENALKKPNAEKVSPTSTKMKSLKRKRSSMDKSEASFLVLNKLEYLRRPIQLIEDESVKMTQEIDDEKMMMKIPYICLEGIDLDSPKRRSVRRATTSSPERKSTNKKRRASSSSRSPPRKVKRVSFSALVHVVPSEIVSTPSPVPREIKSALKIRSPVKTKAALKSMDGIDDILIDNASGRKSTPKRAKKKTANSDNESVSSVEETVTSKSKKKSKAKKKKGFLKLRLAHVQSYTCDHCDMVFLKNIDLQLHLMRLLDTRLIKIPVYRYILPRSFTLTDNEEDKYLKKKEKLNTSLTTSEMINLVDKYTPEMAQFIVSETNLTAIDKEINGLEALENTSNDDETSKTDVSSKSDDTAKSDDSIKVHVDTTKDALDETKMNDIIEDDKNLDDTNEDKTQEDTIEDDMTQEDTNEDDKTQEEPIEDDKIQEEPNKDDIHLEEDMNNDQEMTESDSNKDADITEDDKVEEDETNIEEFSKNETDESQEANSESGLVNNIEENDAQDEEDDYDQNDDSQEIPESRNSVKDDSSNEEIIDDTTPKKRSRTKSEEGENSDTEMTLPTFDDELVSQNTSDNEDNEVNRTENLLDDSESKAADDADVDADVDDSSTDQTNDTTEESSMDNSRDAMKQTATNERALENVLTKIESDLEEMFLKKDDKISNQDLLNILDADDKKRRHSEEEEQDRKRAKLCLDENEKTENDRTYQDDINHTDEDNLNDVLHSFEQHNENVAVI